MLVNDLDLRLERVSDGQVTLPWTLDPATPGSWAVRGDNVRDNVEKAETAAAQAGAYRIIVRHKGTLRRRQRRPTRWWPAAPNRPW